MEAPLVPVEAPPLVPVEAPPLVPAEAGFVAGFDAGFDAAAALGPLNPLPAVPPCLAVPFVAAAGPLAGMIPRTPPRPPPTHRDLVVFTM